MATVVWHVPDHDPEQTNTDKKQQDALKLMILGYDLSKNGDCCLQDPKLDARTACHAFVDKQYRWIECLVTEDAG